MKTCRWERVWGRSAPVWAFGVLLLTGALSCAFGCGHAHTASKGALAAPVPTSSAAASAIEVVPTKTARPDDVAVIFKVSNLARDFPDLVGLIPDDTDAAALKRMSVADLAMMFIGPLSTELRLDRPILVSSTAKQGPKALQIVAVGFDDYERAKRAAESKFRLTPLGAHAVSMSVLEGASGLFDWSHGFCQLRQARQGKGGVLLCGSQKPSEAHAAYLSELSAESRADASTIEAAVDAGAALRATKSSQTANETAPERFGSELVQGLIKKMHDIAFDVRLAHGQTELGLSLEFAQGEDALVDFLLASSPSGAQNVLLKMPASTKMAIYSEGAARNKDRALVDRLFERCFELLPSDEFDPAGRAELRAAFERIALRGGPWLAAWGFDRAAATAAVARSVSSPNDVRLEREARTALEGFSLFAAPDAQSYWVDSIRGIIAVERRYSFPGSRSRVARRPASDASSELQAAHAPPSVEHVSFYVEPPAPAGAPRGTYHLRIDRVPNLDYEPAPNAKKPLGRRELHILAHEDWGYTWLCVSSDAAACTRALSTIKAGARGTLGAEANHAELAAAHGSWVGIGSFDAVRKLSLKTDSPQDREAALKSLRQSGSLGTEMTRRRVFMAETTPPGQDSAGKVRFFTSLQTSELVGLAKMFAD